MLQGQKEREMEHFEVEAYLHPPPWKGNGGSFITETSLQPFQRFPYKLDNVTRFFYPIYRKNNLDGG